MLTKPNTPPTIEYASDGSKYWFTSEGLYIEYKNGTTCWYVNGKRVPTFDEVLVKVKEGKDLTDLEVFVYTGETNFTFQNYDMPALKKLKEQGYRYLGRTVLECEKLFDMQLQMSDGKSGLIYWAYLHNNVRNLVNAHKYCHTALFDYVNARCS